jgi:DNA-binding transcriptional MerR regulator
MVGMDDAITSAEMAAATGISIDTLRYYEREGLLEPVPRTSGGHRRYRREDVTWVQVVSCLRITHMPIRELREFAELVRQGDDRVPDRLTLLRQHRQRVLDRMTELQQALDVLDHKIEVYRAIRTTDGHPEVVVPVRRHPSAHHAVTAG